MMSDRNTGLVAFSLSGVFPAAAVTPARLVGAWRTPGAPRCLLMHRAKPMDWLFSRIGD